MPNPRRAPGLPTVEEVQAGELFFSDHLPVITTIPSIESSMLTYNCLGISGTSGLHAAKTPQWENQEQVTERYKRIAEGLKLAADKQNLDVIALQEVSVEYMIDSLTTALGDDWVIVPNEAHLITCYRKSVYEQVSTEERVGPSGEHARALMLKHLATEQLVNVHNVWGFYRPFPRLTEKYFDDLLAEHEGEAITVILSDTNSRVAPLHDISMNISTGVVPLIFNSGNGAPEDVQVTDFPDAIFFRDLSGNTIQARISIVDLKTGNLEKDERTRDEAQPWPEYRMVMCLADAFKRTSFIPSQNLFEYEASLQRLLGSSLIQCRVAADSFNRRAIGLRLLTKSAFTNYLDEKCQEISGSQTKCIDSTETRGEEASKLFACVFVPEKRRHLLHRAILEYNGFVSGQILTILKDTLQVMQRMISKKSDALSELITTIYKRPLGAASLKASITEWKEKYLECSDVTKRLTANPSPAFFNSAREEAWGALLETLFSDDTMKAIDDAIEAEMKVKPSWSPMSRSENKVSAASSSTSTATTLNDDAASSVAASSYASSSLSA